MTTRTLVVVLLCIVGFLSVAVFYLTNEMMKLERRLDALTHDFAIAITGDDDDEAA